MTSPTKNTDRVGARSARLRSFASYGPEPTISNPASGTRRWTARIDLISTSCPFRGTSRLTQTINGRSPSPCRARMSAIGRSGRNRSTSAPGCNTETGTWRRTPVRTRREMNSLHPATREALDVIRFIRAWATGTVESQ